MDTKSFRKSIVIWVIAVFVLWGLFALFLIYCGDLNLPSSEFGDAFGSFNALISGFAFVAIVVSLIIQREDLKSSIDEMKASNKHSKRTTLVQINSALIDIENLRDKYVQRIGDFKGKREMLDNEQDQWTFTNNGLERIMKLKEELENIRSEINESEAKIADTVRVSV
ncbi:MAG: hypothetical protein KDC79_11625 [Cyclobacteriaceae bacterium]|nr:hypothetical protein [Cyclobacteriaceae bacterium]